MTESYEHKAAVLAGRRRAIGLQIVDHYRTAVDEMERLITTDAVADVLPLMAQLAMSTDIIGEGWAHARTAIEKLETFVRCESLHTDDRRDGDRLFWMVRDNHNRVAADIVALVEEYVRLNEEAL